MTPLISIIVPVYNVEKYIAQCLDSLINQSYSNIEIICVNDGSPDNSAEIIKEYVSKDSRVNLFSKENGGLSSARNFGLSKAKGEFIMFVDSDDWIDTNMISKMFEYKKEIDLYCCSYDRIFENTSKPRDLKLDGLYPADKIQKRIVGLTGDELSDPSQADSLVTACAKIYRRSIIDENNIEFIDTKKIGTEDAFFNIQYLNYSESVFLINKAFYFYRRTNEESLTRTYKPDLYNMWQRLYTKIEKEIKDKDSDFQQALNNRISLGLIGLGLNIMSSNKTTKDKTEELKGIICSDNYKSAINTLPFDYFQLHWKLFFYFAKKGNARGVFLLLKAINILRGK